MTTWFDGFEQDRLQLNGVEIFARFGGTRGKPPLLLLHGFPQTHVMWHRVAQQLAPDYFLVLPDLRGYGDSQLSPGLPDHVNHSKREMARDLAALMTALGAPTFYLCGHDRGGRVAHRLALDHAERVKKLCLIDIAPTLDMYEATNMAFARAYYHWFHLVQPAPLPETMIGGDPLMYLHTKLGRWGSGGLAHVEPQALADYERCLRPATIHAMCEDYRASAGIDLVHDRAGREQGDQVRCDMMVLWGERGVVGRMFDPLALWRAQCAGRVTGQVLPCGHYIPEELPQEAADALWSFFRDA